MGAARAQRGNVESLPYHCYTFGRPEKHAFLFRRPCNGPGSQKRIAFQFILSLPGLHLSAWKPGTDKSSAESSLALQDSLMPPGEAYSILRSFHKRASFPITPSTFQPPRSTTLSTGCQTRMSPGTGTLRCRKPSDSLSN